MQLCASTSRYPGKEGEHSSCLLFLLFPVTLSTLCLPFTVISIPCQKLWHSPAGSCSPPSPTSTFFSLVLPSSLSFSLLFLLPPRFSLCLPPCPYILCLSMFSNKHVARFISFHRQRCVCLAVCVCVAARGKGAPNFCSQIWHTPFHSPWAVFPIIYPAVNSTQSRRQNMQLWQAKYSPSFVAANVLKIQNIKQPNLAEFRQI